jgi:zinc/manganese transport system substrate-binding protein
VIKNGGGYDDFMDRLLKTGRASAEVLDVVRLSGKKDPVAGGFNEHVWYDLPTVKRLAGAIAARLGRLDAAHRAQFRKRAQRFANRIDRLIVRERVLRKHSAGTPIAITEPVPLYLTSACGLVNKTPAAFSRGIEEGTDPSAPVLQQTLNLFLGHQVEALFYNVQTVGPLARKLKETAESAGVAVVPVSETLPAGTHYVTWMTENMDAVAAAVKS